MTSTPSSAAASRYQRLLVPFDGSVTAQRALDEAIALAQACGARLRLVGVFDVTRHASGFEPARRLLDEIVPRARHALQDSLDTACARASSAGVPAQSVVLEGDEIDVPALVNVQVHSFDADLVVVGTHGRTGLDRFLIGSVAEAILRQAEVPVLLVRTNAP